MKLYSHETSNPLEKFAFFPLPPSFCHTLKVWKFFISFSKVQLQKILWQKAYHVYNSKDQPYLGISTRLFDTLIRDSVSVIWFANCIFLIKVQGVIFQILCVYQVHKHTVFCFINHVQLERAKCYVKQPELLLYTLISDRRTRACTVLFLKCSDDVLNIIHCTLFSVHCTLFPVHCTLFSVRCRYLGFSISELQIYK